MVEKRDTPLTDAAAFWTPATEDMGSEHVVHVDIARKLERANAGLVEALERVLSHEKTIVYLFNSIGEPSPAAFSLECERARSALESAKATRGGKV